MRPIGRWSLVTVVAALLAATPIVSGLLPGRGSSVSAADLRQLIAKSSTQPWSGDVITRGMLQVPDTSSFGGVVDLLGEDNTLRAWWRDAEHWRVDDTRPSGEADLYRNVDTVTRWVFESATATVSPYATVRLPDASDILPPRLAARLLSGATKNELSRLPSRRIAGRNAPGLRLTPRSAASTIDRVDIWADDKTGLPLRVEVTGEGDPVVTSALTSLDLDRPSASTVRFEASDTTKVRQRDAIDVAAGANAFAPFVLPDQLASLARRGDPTDLGAVGIYGRGPTALILIPLRRSLARQVRDQLSAATSSRETTVGTALEIGPLSVLITRGTRGGRGTFLLAGTVTPQTLERAADEAREQVTVQ